MFNKVVLTGNFTRDIEMCYGQSGITIGSSAIAVTRKFSVNGEKRGGTCFVDITFLGRQAEVANQYLSKRSKLLIEGRLKFDQRTDQNGQNCSKRNVQAENMEMLGNNQNSANHFIPNNYAETQSYDPYTNENSKKPIQKTSNRNQEKIREIDVDAYDSDDSDLPF